MINPFFKNKGPFDIAKLLKLASIDNIENFNKSKVKNINDLVTANINEITFFHSQKYEALASKTKASYCITSKNLSNLLPASCKKIIVDNVLIATAQITKIFDNTVKDIKKTSLSKKIKFGQNVLIGKNVKIGKNCLIGHNSIIESNVVIGDNCSIGSNVIIRKTLVGNNVNILDGCVIGKKGFGFFPDKKKILDIHILVQL